MRKIKTATATELFLNQKPACCSIWSSGLDRVTIAARDFDEHGSIVAKFLTKIIRYQLGQYCPTCGKKLQHPKEGR